jgi:solute carrier family 34 (sodium-dependent phosphate cotransporter)
LKPIQSIRSTATRVSTVRITLYIVGALLLFLFAIELMTSSLQHLGKNVSETILAATANPFTGLFIGLLVTAMLQSSSTTTALVVALVASNSITMHSAVPIIMGANVGTTITSTIVSLGFINKKKEFKRAVAAGTYHDFFNILTVLILFPLEYHYGFLSTLSQWITGLFFTSHAAASERNVPDFWFGFTPLINVVVDALPNAFLLCLVALALLFSSILIFRKLISDLLKAKSPEVFSRFFFKSPLKSFGWGLITTAAIRSSTITTSVVVPIVAKKIVKLREAAPFILGANIGTTVTAFIAALFYTNTLSAISIAIIHFLFNFIGVLIFLPIPLLRRVPIALANGMGRLTLKYRLAGFVYLLTTFFFIPFSLIYFHQDSIQALDLIYLQTSESNISTQYRVVSKINTRTQQGEWSKFESGDHVNAVPSLIYPITVKNNTLFIGKQMFLFNKPGLCWSGDDEAGKFDLCIDRVIPSIKISDMIFDSVYVYKMQYKEPYDSIVHRYYVSAPLKIYLKHEIERPGDHTRVVEKLVSLETQ